MDKSIVQQERPTIFSVIDRARRQKNAVTGYLSSTVDKLGYTDVIDYILGYRLFHSTRAELRFFLIAPRAITRADLS